MGSSRMFQDSRFFFVVMLRMFKTKFWCCTHNQNCKTQELIPVNRLSGFFSPRICIIFVSFNGTLPLTSSSNCSMSSPPQGGTELSVGDSSLSQNLSAVHMCTHPPTHTHTHTHEPPPPPQTHREHNSDTFWGLALHYFPICMLVPDSLVLAPISFRCSPLPPACGIAAATLYCMACLCRF